jgi:hypothetical protein
MMTVHVVPIVLFLQAADYIAATAATRSLLTSFPIHQVRGVTGPESPESPETTTNVKYVFIGVVLVLLASLLIGVLVAAQRKRAQGITWFPEGFFRNNRFVCILHFDPISCICVALVNGLQKEIPVQEIVISEL